MFVPNKYAKSQHILNDFIFQFVKYQTFWSGLYAWIKSRGLDFIVDIQNEMIVCISKCFG